MKKLLIVLVPVVLLFIGFAAATLGFVNVPGISPQKFGKPVLASDSAIGGLIWSLANPLQRLGLDLTAAQKKIADATPPEKKVTKQTADPEKGRAELADLWNGVKIDKLEGITATWQPTALAPILIKMDPDQVSAYLSNLDPKRADQISKAIQIEASKLPPPKPSNDGTQTS